MAPKKRKNRSSGAGNSTNISQEKEEKRPRSVSGHSSQRTLEGYIEQDMATGNRTFTTDREAGDCQSPEADLRTMLGENFDALHEKFNSIETKIEHSEQTLSEKFSEYVELLKGMIFELQTENDKLKKKVGEQGELIEDMQSDIECLRKMIEKEREYRNDLEQYQRRDSVRFLGIQEKAAETLRQCEEKVLDVINNVLGLAHIGSRDISVAHRVKGASPRPIIVKFLSRKHKNEVIGRRRLLKGTKRAIIEDLTPLNRSRLSAAKNHPDVKNAWTKEGIIHVLLESGGIVKLRGGTLNAIDEAAPKANDEMSITAPPPNSHRLRDNYNRSDIQTRHPITSTPTYHGAGHHRLRSSQSTADAGPSSSRAAGGAGGSHRSSQLAADDGRCPGSGRAAGGAGQNSLQPSQSAKDSGPGSSHASGGAGGSQHSSQSVSSVTGHRLSPSRAAGGPWGGRRSSQSTADAILRTSSSRAAGGAESSLHSSQSAADDGRCPSSTRAAGGAAGGPHSSQRVVTIDPGPGSGQAAGGAAGRPHPSADAGCCPTAGQSSSGRAETTPSPGLQTNADDYPGQSQPAALQNSDNTGTPMDSRDCSQDRHQTSEDMEDLSVSTRL